jgi:hypothetical protein
VQVIAILVTVLLGLAGVALQAKLARDANHAEMEHDRTIAERDKVQHTAGVLLERVKLQMTNVLRPISSITNSMSVTMMYMARELGFDWLKLNSFEATFIRPFDQCPHVEVLTRQYLSQKEFHDNWWHKWSPHDLQVLCPTSPKYDW